MTTTVTGPMPPNVALDAVVARLDATDTAIIAGDATGFAASFAPELMVNSPADRVLSGAQAAGAIRTGLIDYASVARTIEHAELRGNGELLWMGREVVEPRGRNRHAGQTLTYRVTEIWRPEGGNWLLSVRHATIAAVG